MWCDVNSFITEALGPLAEYLMVSESGAQSSGSGNVEAGWEAMG